MDVKYQMKYETPEAIYEVLLKVIHKPTPALKKSNSQCGYAFHSDDSWKRPKLGERTADFIVRLMVESGQWDSDNITEEQVLLLVEQLFERFGVVKDEFGNYDNILLI